MTKEVMKQALDALNESGLRWPNIVEAIQALEKALKQEQGEPVAWFRKEDEEKIYYATKAWDDCLPLYTTPQTKEWVGLTKEDADNIECWFREEIENDRFSVENLIAHIEAKLKERNT